MKKCSALIALLSLVATQIHSQTINTPAAHEFLTGTGQVPVGQVAQPMRQIYTELLRTADNSKLTKVSDLSYGPHASHLLDVHYDADRNGDNLPVVIFVHGGGFSRGAKSDGFILDNIVQYFAKRGMVGVNMTYRLAGIATWPGASEDVAAAVDWVRSNIKTYGGDPDNIFIMGHSAGAAHVAGYLFFNHIKNNQAEDGIRGGVLLSGVYIPRRSGGDIEYYGEDEALWEARAPLNHAGNSKVPLMLIDAEHDSYATQTHTLKMMQALCERDRVCPAHMRAMGHNHVSMTYHINTADDSIAHEMLLFMQRLMTD